MLKVSVIIPIYNMGLYLEECLKSIISQTLKEIEVICINDGSTDNSLEILKKYALRYRNIIIINQKNFGVGKSRNNGINVAKGEFVAFMDPDDFYPNNDILECLYNNAKANNVFVCGGSLSKFSNGRIIEEYYGWLEDYKFTKNEIVKYSKYQFAYGFTRFIYDLEFLKRNKLYFPSYTRYEDPQFFVRAMICANEFYAIKKITYCYRKGHKKVILTLEKTIDYAKGVLDVLNIARKYEFKKLQSIVFEVMYNELTPAIYKYIAKGNLQLKDLLYQIKNSINLKQLEEKNQTLKNMQLLQPNEVEDYIQTNIQKEKDFLNIIQGYEEIIIYGAGNVAESVAEYLEGIDGIRIICFAVTDATKNSYSINGVSLRKIDEMILYRENALVLIATYTNHHKEIINNLETLQFKNILPIYINEFQLFLMRKQ